jgi:proline iminopeptidase
VREEPFELAIADGTLHGHRSGEGRPALLLHGGPAVPDYTASCAEALGGLFSTTRYTQRGTPPSTVGPPYSIESHMADAIAVLDHFQLDKAWAVGHSWGGHLALHLLVSHPERLEGIVCIDPLGAVDVFPEYGEVLSRHRTPEQNRRSDEIEERRRSGEVTEEELLERWAMTWPLFFVNSERALPLPERVGAECSIGTNASMMAHFERRTLEERLPAASLPALVVHGREDVLPLRSATATAALIPEAQLEVISGSGHFPWVDKPAEFRAAVERFFA